MSTWNGDGPSTPVLVPELNPPARDDLLTAHPAVADPPIAFIRMAFCLYVLIAAAMFQSAASPADQLIRLPRSLQPDEVSAVLAASRAAISGKTFNLTHIDRQDGLQVLMREDGWPRIVRFEGGMEGGVVTSTGETTHWSDYFIHIVDYTGVQARRCDGSSFPGELVVTYEHSRAADAWTAAAGTSARSSRGFPAGVPVANPVFDVLRGTINVHSDSGVTMIDGRSARGFTAPLAPPPTTYGVRNPEGRIHQTLWIDIEWLLPVQWDVIEDGILRDSRALRYVALGLQPPAGIDAPRCIQ